MLLVRAENHSLAAGRDLIVNITMENGRVGAEDFIYSLSQALKIPTDQLKSFFKDSQIHSISAENISKLIERLVIELDIQDHMRQGRYSKLENITAQVSESFQKLSVTLSNLESLIAQRKYREAHSEIHEIITDRLLPENYTGELIFDYFQTGYLAFANEGDRSAVQRLCRQAENEYGEHLSPALIVLLAEMEQEYATRDDDTVLLKENLRLLQNLINRHPHTRLSLEYIDILIGVCQRRIGERNEPEFLDLAEKKFRQCLLKETRRNIEISNNLAITLVRKFENSGKIEELNEAETVLKEIKIPEDSSLISEFQSYPKSLNNLGNVFKQRIKIEPRADFVSEAIRLYSEAEKYWTEENAPYEWAMLQKNKADTRLAFGQAVFVGEEFLKKGLEGIKDALRYRTLEDAPYQYKKTVSVKEGIKALIAKN
ncbi:MAG: hypothetical protein AAGE18_05275 [Pseudomonadota bacterium]